jgi:hypothetical protein
MRNRNARLLMRPELLTRRKFFSRFLIAASAVAAIGGADALFLEPRNLVSEHIDIRLARLPEEFHGFRIAQISEIHFGPYMGKAAGARAAVGGIFPGRLAGTDRGLCFPLFWRIEWSAGGAVYRPLRRCFSGGEGSSGSRHTGQSRSLEQRGDCRRRAQRSRHPKCCETAQFRWNGDAAGYGSPEPMMRWSKRQTWARRCTTLLPRRPLFRLPTSRTSPTTLRVSPSTCNCPGTPTADRSGCRGFGGLIPPALARKYPIG